MCDFKPGDEVVCVTHQVDNRGLTPVALADTPIGWIGIVTEVREHPQRRGMFGIRLHNWPLPRQVMFVSDAFQKVERRADNLSIETFLTIKPGFEEPRRPKVPARKRERA